MRLDVLNKIEHLRGADGLLNKSEMARRLNCDRRTVDRYLKETTGKRKPRKLGKVLDEYEETIRDKVDNYGSTAMAVYKFIQKKGYDGGYKTVNNFVKKHKNEAKNKATIRFETNPGLQAQVDWKEKITMYNKDGEAYEVNIFLMVLGYSRVKYIKLTTDRTQKTLFECMVKGFQYFGGIPKEILFDNMATVVDRKTSTFKKVSINKDFDYFSKDAGFEIITCRPYRPKTKGKVEALAKLMSSLPPIIKNLKVMMNWKI